MKPGELARLLDKDFQLAVDVENSEFWEYSGGAWRRADRIVRRHVIHYAPDQDRLRQLVEDVELITLPAVLEEAGKVVTPDEPDPRFINHLGGLFVVETGETIPHDPAVMSFSRVPLVPETGRIRMPVTNAFLSEITCGDKDLEDYLLDLMADALVPGNQRQAATMLVGEGRNGKGALLRLMGQMFRKCDQTTETFQSMSSRFGPITLYGSAFNYDADMSARYISDTSVFKKATGGDVMAMERKYKGTAYAKVWASMWCSVNKIPRSADSSYGFLRRWDVVDFDAKVTPVPGFEDQLAAELPSLVTFLMDRARRQRGNVRRAGAGLERLNAAVDLVKAWMTDEDSGMAAMSGTCPRSQIYGRFKAWAEDEGIRPDRLATVTKSDLQARLAAAGVPLHKAHGGIWTYTFGG
ncbi:DNA primase family protein [Mycobacterium pseudokansasii]|uniref:SF3 helicase domain-containing protein n=1 Tax=Mycobacterium pseudokansasii TaxID=2341080 RepID=A0A498QVV1_9MYCO|nr:phage/plasmid primase, P4 family [Mycobacterium pseudokansasii]VBA56002.1 hypothetical protein LAUMK142_05341 [Mycobacterium pseudokansasii]